MTDHFDVLVAAGRVVVSPSAGGDALKTLRAAASGPTDWGKLFQLAESHGMGPLLWRALIDHASDALPAAVRDEIAARRVVAGAAALAATKQLIEALDALERAGIRAMPYKGPVLSLDAYGDAALRQSDDIDVLISPADVERAWATLSAIGYRVKDRWTWKRWRAANAWQGQCALVAPDGGIPLDLHWRTCDVKLPWNIALDELMRHARSREVAGHALRIPSIADQITLVLLHGARHGWDRLEPFACVAALLGRSGDDAVRSELTERAGASGVALAGLCAATVYFDAAPTAAIKHLVEPSQDVRRLSAIAIGRVRAGDAGARRDASLHLDLLGSTWERIRYSALVVLQPTVADYEALRLPDALRFLYPFARVLRLTTR